MLTKVEPRDIDLGADRSDSQKLQGILRKRIWLPKFVYDVLPYFYLTAGFAAFFATLYISDWFWILPHYLLFSAACLHLGFAVRSRRTNEQDSDGPR